MKDFFEDLGKRLGETAETMTNKAGEAIEIQRLKSQSRSLARGNAVDLMELGKMIYDRYKSGETVEEAAQELCEAIQSREKTMEEYDRKIAKIKGATECRNCGRMVGRDMAYCPYCGEKTDDEKEDGDVFEDESEESYADSVKEKAADMAEMRRRRWMRRQRRPETWRRKLLRRPEIWRRRRQRRQAIWQKKQHRKSVRRREELQINSAMQQRT